MFSSGAALGRELRRYVLEGQNCEAISKRNRDSIWCFSLVSVMANELVKANWLK